MEFCPNCGKLLMPTKGMVKCRCGYEKSLSKDDIERMSVSEIASAIKNEFSFDNFKWQQENQKLPKIHVISGCEKQCK